MLGFDVQRGNYCSFAHGQVELRHKNRKFADLSCKELIAPIMSLSTTGAGGARNEAAFAHFRQRPVRSQMPRPVRREPSSRATHAYGSFGERERRYSAPERILRERMADDDSSARRASDDDIDERIKVRTQLHKSTRLTILMSLMTVLSVCSRSIV